MEILRRCVAHFAWTRAGAVWLALAPTFWVTWPLWHTVPLSFDHTTHMFQSWHFWTEMLGRGRLRGWTHVWGFGFPSDELVPPGSEMWVCAFRVLTVGQLSWMHTYALAFAGVLFLKSYAAYRFTRTYFSRGAAVVCAWATIFDPGGLLEGGWEWHTNYGVWPVTLAISLSMLSLSRLERVLRNERASDVWVAGALLGAGLITHQMTLVLFATVVPLLVVDYLLRDARRRIRPLLRMGGALAFGVALSAFFLVPFFARTHATQDLGWSVHTLEQVSRQVFLFRIFTGVWTPVQALGLLGVLLVVRRQQPGWLFMGGSALALAILSSNTLVQDLHLEQAITAFVKVETPRMLLLCKRFWFALAGFAAVELVRLSAPAPGPDARRNRIVASLVIVASLATLLVFDRQHFKRTRLDREFVGESEIADWSDFRRAMEWARQRRAETDEHYRIAFHMDRNDHRSMVAPMFNDTLYYKIGYTPAQIFNRFPTTDEGPVLRALSVKYLISAYPLHGRADLEYLESFGPFSVHAVKNYTPDPFTISGPGEGTTLEFGPERIRIRVTGATADTRLKLHVANFDRWRAELDGEPLPIVTVPVYGVEYPVLMEVPVAHDGELVFRYAFAEPDWLGFILTLAAMPMFGLGWWFTRKSLLGVELLERLEGHKRWLGRATIAGGVLVLALVVHRRSDRTSLLPRDSLFHGIDDPSEMKLNGHECRLIDGLDYRCGRHRLKAKVVAGAWGLHLCMSTRDRGDLRIEMPWVASSFLRVDYDPANLGVGSITMWIDGRQLGSAHTRPAVLRKQQIQFDTRDVAGQEVDLQVRLKGAALHCFDLHQIP